jgi:hypothetical protein
MEKDMPVSAKPAFKAAWLDILSRKVLNLSINQVLSFLYLLVAFYHPAFQFATSSMQETLLKAYSDGSAVKLMRDHTVVEYTHSFVDTLLSRTFPFLSYPKLSFPYLSSLVTLSDIEEERKQTLPEEPSFSELVRHQLSDMDIKALFESPTSTPKSEVFDVDFNVDESNVDSQAVAAGSEDEEKVQPPEPEAQGKPSESNLGKKGKKRKECKHRGGCVSTLNLKTGKVEKVCKKCYETSI